MNLIESLYIHFPFCRHLCNYCDFYKTIPKGSEDLGLFEKLFLEMESEHAILLDRLGYEMENLKTLYIGGGTPSLWGERGAHFLAKQFERMGIRFDEEREFTLEVNPGTWTEEGIQAWREFGINRFSLGIQSLRADYLKYLDRVHSVEDVFDTLNFFNQNKLNFSVDFMLGLPESLKLERNILGELEQILKFSPEHISLYILTPKANYPFKARLPTDDFLEEEYLRVADFLSEKGFDHYEVSNFASGKRNYSQHNLRYWRSEAVGALGPSAVGFLPEHRFRYKWQVSSPKFTKEEIEIESLDLEKLYMGLRINEGIRLDDHFSSVELSELSEVFKKWELGGLARSRAGVLSLTSRGFIVLDTLIDQIFLTTK